MKTWTEIITVFLAICGIIRLIIDLIELRGIFKLRKYIRRRLLQELKEIETDIDNLRKNVGKSKDLQKEIEMMKQQA